MRIENNLAVVTGGGSGMGEATCLRLAQEGAIVFVLDKSLENAKKVAAKINGVAFECDVSDAKSCEQVFDNAIKTFHQPLAFLVHCAGIAPAKKMIGSQGPLDLDWFENVIKINLTGTFNVMRLAANLMSKAPLQDEERGVIINTASIAAFEGQMGQIAYSASKGGVAAMTLPAARELASLAIRVMTIAPGFIDTPMIGAMPEKVKTNLTSQTVFPKRFGKAAEFAALVCHIIENPLLNGEIIRLDGAIRMQP